MKKHIIEQSVIFFSVTKWVLLSSFIGVTIGFIIAFFLNTIHQAEVSRDFLPFDYYYLLPFALMLSVYLVRKFAPNAKGHGTEKVIEAVHKRDGKIEVAVIPIKLLATIITLFAGGSAGKEGPGAQIGAGSASFLSDLFKFSKKDRKKLVICGISAGFASVFGTPISGAIFGVEVLIVGIIMYDVLLPSFISGFAAYTTAKMLGVNYTYFNLHFSQAIPIDLTLVFQVIIAGLFFGIVSDFLITAFKKSEYYIKRIDINIYTKAFLGGSILVVLSFFVGDRYFGLGLNTISDVLYSDPSIAEDVPWYAFIMKTIFTSITLSAGGSGGVITPIFYIGATSGHFLGGLFGDNLALFAALGFTSVLAGAANAPIAATIMAVELFGVEIAHYAAISAVISFLITGHRSIFFSQILKMKKSDMLSIEFGKDFDNNDIDLSSKSKEKIVKMRRRLKNIIRHTKED
ncbi:chloride channel protein [Malaciobacter marinus]|uniref:Voltage-gated chloride channel n=1 Tax=Malaciobacter marinus TaxID=505249 RepID=A0A347TNB7_9BACT|nr:MULTISPECIES: chloride channel protein [Malaciobacter]AXX88095.1 voltage-gated chloride channel [Malaciobacter marinus]PHO13811.1 voltage-gated chloride channel [Malaciobacter marinus]PHO15613.1 voltage-gated chloride channel [Malaciobacter marinus]RYA24227.1 voltage-gated chloride channel [Malaciobacter halophilus]